MKFERAAALGLTSSLIFGAACSGNTAPQHSDQTEEAIGAIKEYDRLERFAQEGNRSFNHDIRVEHQATFMLGLCMGWESREGNEVTVTMNPGVGIHAEGSRELDMIMAGEVKGSENNIPQVTFKGEIYTYIRPDGKVNTQMLDTIRFSTADSANATVSPIQERQVTETPVAGPQGVVSYMDRHTGQPLAATIEVPGPFTHETVLNACDVLLPGFSEKTEITPSVPTTRPSVAA